MKTLDAVIGFLRQKGGKQFQQNEVRGCTSTSDFDPELARVINEWSSLSTEIRRAILALIEGKSAGQRKGCRSPA
jgi:hypothetical protein